MFITFYCGDVHGLPLLNQRTFTKSQIREDLFVILLVLLLSVNMQDKHNKPLA